MDVITQAKQVVQQVAAQQPSLYHTAMAVAQTAVANGDGEFATQLLCGFGFSPREASQMLWLRWAYRHNRIG